MTITHITDKERELQAQLDHSRGCVKQMGRLNELMVSELAEARVELDKLKPDAERYQWLFDGNKVYSQFFKAYQPWDGCDGKNGFDAAIDNAMKEQS